MALFESMLVLVLVAIVLLQVSRRFSIPYPTMLALAGVIVAALPWAPEVEIDPHLALALFIAPALLDAAYDLPPRELRRYFPSLLALAGAAVLVTIAVVAWVGVLSGLPLRRSHSTWRHRGAAGRGCGRCDAGTLRPAAPHCDRPERRKLA